MAQVTLTMRADGLGSVFDSGVGANDNLVATVQEAGPAAARVKLVLRLKKHLTTMGTAITPAFTVVQILSAKGRFRATLAHYLLGQICHVLGHRS